MNQLPTYENMIIAYEFLVGQTLAGASGGSYYGDQFRQHGFAVRKAIEKMESALEHRKERMFYMIINLLRMRPQIFMEQINAFKARCDMRQTSARGMSVFSSEDVDAAMEMLGNTSYTHPLELNNDLIDFCKEPRASY